MTTLLIDYRAAALSVSAGVLQVRCPDGSVQRVPLAQLERLTLVSDASIDASAIRQLAAARVPVQILRGRSRADSALLWPQLGDGIRRLAQRRAFDDPDSSLRLARAVLRARLLGQTRLLDEARADNARARYPLTRARRLIASQRMRLGQIDSIDSLRGVEGACSRIYFQGFARLISPAWQFPGRRRRPPPDPVNACLSLGFALLQGRVLEQVHRSGLDAALGVLHRPSHNRPSLACDLVEGERWRVERMVWHLLRSGALKPSDFDAAGYGIGLAKSGRGLFFATIEPELRAAERRTRQRVEALVRWLLRHHAQDMTVLEDPDYD